MLLLLLLAVVLHQMFRCHDDVQVVAGFVRGARSGVHRRWSCALYPADDVIGKLSISLDRLHR